jgi:hypothetical protein
MDLKITIPTKLSEINLKQYQAFLKVAKDNKDTEFLQQKMLQIFCGVDLKHVSSMRFKDVNDITNNLSNLFTQKTKLINRFTIGSLEFGFIPNLEEMTNGEYMDLDTYITDWDSMHKAMAVLFRPIIKKQKDKYLIEQYNGSITYAEVMEHMPLDVALGAVVFFWDLGNELLSSTMNYLENNKEVQTTLKAHNLANAGDGINLSMPSLKEMFQDLMPLRDYPYTNA